MNYNIRWDLLQPVDVGGAVQAGFERGATQSALASLATDPTNEGALSRLAMFQPETAMRMRDRGRQEQYRTAVRGALTPEGAVDQNALGRAVAGFGDPEDVIRYQAGRSTAARAERETADAQHERLARLAEGATAENWAQTRAAAIDMGVPAENIPEAYDEGWLQRQRTILRAFAEPNERTSFQRDLEAAGYDLSTPEGQTAARRFIENRYAAPPRIMMVNGQPMLVGGGGDAGGGGAPELTDDDVRQLDGGGPAPAAGPATFP